MNWISSSEVLIVGLGLIGGSYARALSRLGYRVSALDRDEEAIAYALKRGWIARGGTVPDRASVGAADAVIFALYPSALAAWVREYGHLIKRGALITDVTGVKAGLAEEVQSILGDRAEFIAAHPMAGREVSGVRNADDGIFRNANYIVVPTERNTPAAIEWCKTLGRLLGFRTVTVLSPKAHDEMIGFVSQLTHCIAVALMTCSDNERLAACTGDSFRELTRIARINETMWCELFLQNRDELLRWIDRFTEELASIRSMLAERDENGLREKMRLSTERRAKFDREGGTAE